MSLFYLGLVIFLSFSINNSKYSAFEVQAKEYKRCEIIKLLEKYNFQRSFWPAWICLINAESGRESTKVTSHSSPNRKSYGLFQISSMDYCNPGKKGGLCQTKCEDFLNEDLLDDTVCAKNVQEYSGFKAWPKYDSFCKKNLEQWVDEIKKCMVTTRNGFSDDTYYSSSSRQLPLTYTFLMSFAVMIFQLYLCRNIVL